MKKVMRVARYGKGRIRRSAADYCEQARSLIKMQIEAMPFSLLFAISLEVIMRGYTHHPAPLVWLGAIFSVVGLRYGIAKYFQSRLHNPGFAQLYLTLCVIGNGVTGCMWALVPAFFVDLNNSGETLLLILLSGITAGGTIQAGCCFAAAAAIFLPIEGTVELKFLLAGSKSNYVMAFDVLLFIAFLTKVGLSSEKSFFEMLRLNTDATALASSLEREHAAAQAAAARLYQLANHDSLTGLANRASFTQSLSAWLAQGLDHGEGFFLLLLDLDRFKAINDTLGHGAGDRVLREVAARLSRAIPQGHIVARLGGDEFAILVVNPASSTDDPACVIADTVLAALNGKFIIDRTPVDIAISLGLAAFPQDGTTAEALLANADLALYAAKDAGRCGWRRIDEALLASAKMARDIEADLPQALRQGDIEVWYQPQISLHDQSLIGLEAFLHWEHPSYGWIAPGIIVCAAVRIQASHLLTEFVLEQVCRTINALPKSRRTAISIGINISPRELDHHGLPDLVRRLIGTYGIDPRCLELEITEEAYVTSAAALTTLQIVSQLGLRIAIDDFGAGRSSIDCLRSPKVSKIKIDRNLVAGFVSRPADRMFVQTIIAIGRSMNIDVLAQGVGTLEEAILLQASGCHMAQGDVFAIAMPSDALAQWMADHPPMRPRSVNDDDRAMGANYG